MSNNQSSKVDWDNDFHHVKPISREKLPELSELKKIEIYLEKDDYLGFLLASASENLPNLIAANDIELEADKAFLKISYPLVRPALKMIKPNNSKGFTLRELVVSIAETYQEIYHVETNSQTEQTPPINEKGFLLNRPKSDGTFGIWGHGLGDLSLASIMVYKACGRIWLSPVVNS